MNKLMKWTVVFALTAMSMTSATFASAAQSQTPTVTLTDSLDNWSNTLSHTSNMSLANIGTDASDGDKSVAQRKDAKAGSFIYEIKDIKSVNVKIYFNDAASDSNNIKLYGSSTNGKYKELKVSKDKSKESKGFWYRVNYSVSSMPANTNYLKVELPVNSKGYYTPVISEVKITSVKQKNLPDLKPGANEITMTDTLDNWKKTYSHTANWILENIGKESSEGDASAAQRKTNTTESFIYNIQDIKSAAVKIYFNDSDSDSNNLKIYAGTTNGKYTEVKATKDKPFGLKGYWYRVNYTVKSFPANTHFLKIELPKNSKGYYTPVISSVKITSLKPKVVQKPTDKPVEKPVEKPAETTPPTSAGITDSLDDWSKTFSHTTNLSLTNVGAEATEGDTSVIQRTSNTAESLVYNLKDMKSANIKIYFNDGSSDSNNFKVYASATDGDYQEVKAVQDTPLEIKGSWFRVNYSVNNLPAGTNYLKIEMPGNTKGNWTPVISEVKVNA
jgi:hypothetical protein